MDESPPTIPGLTFIGANIKAISLVGDYVSRLPFLYGKTIRPDYSDDLFSVSDPDYYLEFIKGLGYNSVAIPVYLDLALPLKPTELNANYVKELKRTIKIVSRHNLNPILSFPQRHISRRLGGYGLPDWCLPDEVLSYFNPQNQPLIRMPSTGRNGNKSKETMNEKTTVSIAREGEDGQISVTKRNIKKTNPDLELNEQNKTFLPNPIGERTRAPQKGNFANSRVYPSNYNTREKLPSVATATATGDDSVTATINIDNKGNQNSSLNDVKEHHVTAQELRAFKLDHKQPKSYMPNRNTINGLGPSETESIFRDNQQYSINYSDNTGQKRSDNGSSSLPWTVPETYPGSSISKQPKLQGQQYGNDNKEYVVHKAAGIGSGPIESITAEAIASNQNMRSKASSSINVPEKNNENGSVQMTKSTMVKGNPNAMNNTINTQRESNVIGITNVKSQGEATSTVVMKERVVSKTTKNEKKVKKAMKSKFYNSNKFNKEIMDVLIPIKVTCNNIEKSAELHKSLLVPELHRDEKTKKELKKEKKEKKKAAKNLKKHPKKENSDEFDEDSPISMTREGNIKMMNYHDVSTDNNPNIYPGAVKLTDTVFAQETSKRLEYLLNEYKQGNIVELTYGQLPVPLIGHKLPNNLITRMRKLEKKCIKYLQNNKDVLYSLCGAIRTLCSRLSEHVVAISPFSCLTTLPVGDDGYTTEYEPDNIMSHIYDFVKNNFMSRLDTSLSGLHESLALAAFRGSNNLKKPIRFKFDNVISSFADNERGLSISKGNAKITPDEARESSRRVMKNITKLRRPVILTSLKKWKDNGSEISRYLIHIVSVMLPSQLTVSMLCEGVSLHSMIVDIHCDTTIGISPCTPFMKRISGSPIGWMCGAASSNVLTGHSAKSSGYYDIRQNKMETSPRAATIEELNTNNINENTDGKTNVKNEFTGNTITKTKKGKDGTKIKVGEVPLTSLTVVTQYPNHHTATEMYHSGSVILTGSQSIGGIFISNFEVIEEKKDKKLKKRLKELSDSDNIPPPHETLAVMIFKTRTSASLEEMILSKAALVQTYGLDVLNKMRVNVIGSTDDNSVMKAIKNTDGISGVFVSNDSDIGVITSIHGNGISVKMTPVGVKSVTVKNGNIHKGIKSERVTGAMFYDCEVK